jgi:DNA (cytosine-5)-methyltransferase 1
VRELSLFTGAGGGLLGSILLDWTPVGYVEINDYCQRVLAQRIKDGCLPDAPIFGDIRAFIDQGYAASYTGLVDVVTGGFPCQPFAISRTAHGGDIGADDARNMWPQCLDAMRIIEPEFGYFENVPTLVSGRHGYFRTILSDLAAIGYDVRWGILSARDCEAAHKRDRLWILAYRRWERVKFAGDFPLCECCGEEPFCEKHGCHWSECICPGPHSNEEDGWDIQEKPWGLVAYPIPDAFSEGLEGNECEELEGAGEGRQDANITRSDWWSSEPSIQRVADGVANRMDRLRAIGNGQVPAVVRAAWQILGGQS